MLTRILNNNRETISYPLAVPNSGYPNGLISDICLAISCDRVAKSSPVYVDSVVCTSAYISVMLSTDIDGKSAPLGYGYANRSDAPIVYIFSEQFGDCLGWVLLGSASNTYATYVQRVKVCSSCIQWLPAGMEFDINGVTYDSPERLDIIVDGDLSIDGKDGSYVIGADYSQASDTYDMDNIEDIGPITSLNGVPSTTGCICITLPIESGDVSLTTIKGPSTEEPTTIFTINCINPEFSCPDSDILLSIINTADSGLDNEETPLRSFIAEYKK